MKEFNSNAPIYLQIMEEFKRQIVSGERAPGSKVESVRDLAQGMGVNPNTMQRAFAELEREGLIFTERTSGRFITTDSTLISKVRDASAVGLITDFVNRMSRSGFSKQEILRLTQECLLKSDLPEPAVEE